MRPEGRPNLASSSRRAPVRPRAGPVPGGPERRQHPGAAPARQRAPRNPEAGHVPPGAWLSDRAGRSPGLRAARPRQIPWGTPTVPRETPGHCAPEPTVPKRPCATLTSGCSRTASFPGALTPKGQGDADGGRSPAVRPQRAACARGLKREARIGCTCSARPGALGAGRAHVAPHLAANGSAPALPLPVKPGGPARGLGSERRGGARGTERSWGRRQATVRFLLSSSWEALEPSGRVPVLPFGAAATVRDCDERATRWEPSNAQPGPG